MVLKTINNNPIKITDMNKINRYITSLVLMILMVAGLTFCTKTFNEKTIQQTNFNNQTLIQVYMAIVNASRNYVYVDGKPITGSLLSSGSVFPSSAYASSIEPGLKAFLVRDTLSTTTQVPLSFAEVMEVGKNHTIFIYDSINIPRQKTVQTIIKIPADTTANLRFANFTHSKTAIPGVDIFSKRLNTNVFTNVNITDVTGFIPYPSAFTDTLYVRSTGSTTNLATLNTMNLNPKRSYTLVFRGSYALASGTTARTLSVFTNY
jgi:hypothetical protein